MLFTTILDTGTFFSSSVDGTMRIWAPQRGRGILLNPFFESTVIVNTRDIWLTALAVNPRGNWSCYVGDSTGGIDIYRKSDGISEIDRLVNSFNHHLMKFKRWENMHSLGIAKLEVSPAENYLISLSFDGTCKISDSTLGVPFFTISNPKYAMYVGAVWLSDESNLYLTDELGHLEVFSAFNARSGTIVSLDLAKPTSDKHHSAILSSHTDPVLGMISQFRRSDPTQFLTLIPPGILGDVFTGEIALWKLVSDSTCREFIGHEGTVLDIGVLDGLMYEAMRHRFDAMLSVSGDESSYTGTLMGSSVSGSESTYSMGMTSSSFVDEGKFADDRVWGTTLVGLQCIFMDSIFPARQIYHVCVGRYTIY